MKSVTVYYLLSFHSVLSCAVSQKSWNSSLNLLKIYVIDCVVSTLDIVALRFMNLAAVKENVITSQILFLPLSRTNANFKFPFGELVGRKFEYSSFVLDASVYFLQYTSL
jgi:hypothetical protein